MSISIERESTKDALKAQVVACMSEIRRFYKLADDGAGWLDDADQEYFDALPLSIEYRSSDWVTDPLELEPTAARVILCHGGPHVEVFYRMSGYRTPDEVSIRGHWWGDHCDLSLSDEQCDALEWAFDAWGVNSI